MWCRGCEWQTSGCLVGLLVVEALAIVSQSTNKKNVLCCFPAVAILHVDLDPNCLMLYRGCRLEVNYWQIHLQRRKVINVRRKPRRKSLDIGKGVNRSVAIHEQEWLFNK